MYVFTRLRDSSASIIRITGTAVTQWSKCNKDSFPFIL